MAEKHGGRCRDISSSGRSSASTVRSLKSRPAVTRSLCNRTKPCTVFTSLRIVTARGENLMCSCDTSAT